MFFLNSFLTGEDEKPKPSPSSSSPSSSQETSLSTTPVGVAAAGNGFPWSQNTSNTSYSTDKQSKSVEEPGHIGVPDGGLRAWLVVLGGFLDFTIAFGLLNSFGTFQARYESEWRWLSTSTITWIGSVQLFILFLGGLVIGPAFDKYGSRGLMITGTVFCLLSFLCTSFATEYYHYLLSQGILFGIGNAMLFYPATGAIAEWFNTKRGLALGIALSGSSVGGIFWPIVVNKLFTVVDAPWVHRIIAVISIPIVLLSCYLVKERQDAAGHDTEGNRIKTPEKSFRNAVFEWRFFALCVALFFIYGGMLVPFYYIPLYAIEFGIEPTMANNLLAIGYAGSVVGRVASGWMADRVGRFNILFLMGLCTSVVTFCWIRMTSLGGMIAFALLFGLFSGGLIPLGSACVAQTTPDMGHIGLRIGVMMAICSIGALIGGPISGAIKDSTSEWFGVHSFSASATLFGAFLLLLVRFWWQPQPRVIF